MGTSDRTWARGVLSAVLIAGCAHAPATGPSQPALSLQAPDGADVTLASLTRDRAATVLVFWSGGCPCVRRYQERVDALLDRYPADRVRVVGVSSNAGESFDEVQRVARERGVRVPIYRDRGGKLAEAVGARSTPTAVILGGGGAVKFRGWIDNERLPGQADREPWLEDALQALLAAREFRARTPTYGCVITRSLFGEETASSPCCTETPASGETR